MVVRVAAWVVALVVLALPVATVAQYREHALERLPSVWFLTSPWWIGPNGEPCGLTEDGLNAAIMEPLDGSRLRISRLGTDGSHLFLNVPVMHFDGVCAVLVEIELRRQVTINSTGHETSATVWRTGRLLKGPSAGFGERVNDLVRELTEDFLSEWEAQNPKPEAAP